MVYASRGTFSKQLPFRRVGPLSRESKQTKHWQSKPSELKILMSMCRDWSRTRRVFRKRRPLLAAKWSGCSRFDCICWPRSVMICALTSEPSFSSRSTTVGWLVITAKHSGVCTSHHRHTYSCLNEILRSHSAERNQICAYSPPCIDPLAFSFY